MEIYGKVINQKGEPIVGASIQRYYPGGEIYSAAIISALDGSFLAPVPGTSYYWVVSAPGYLSTPVSLQNATTFNYSSPVVAQLEPDPSVGVAVNDYLTSEEWEAMQANQKVPAIVWILGGAAAAAAGVALFGSPRLKVKLRKILP